MYFLVYLPIRFFLFLRFEMFVCLCALICVCFPCYFFCYALPFELLCMLVFLPTHYLHWRLYSVFYFFDLTFLNTFWFVSIMHTVQTQILGTASIYVCFVCIMRTFSTNTTSSHLRIDFCIHYIFTFFVAFPLIYILMYSLCIFTRQAPFGIIRMINIHT